MEQFVNKVIGSLALSKDKLAWMVQRFNEELDKGLKYPNQMLRPQPTFIESLPSGDETGTFLTVDLGGSNLRIGIVDLLGSGKFTFHKSSTNIPDSVKTSGHAVFNFIADQIVDFLSHFPSANQSNNLGFTFSFPVSQASLTEGRIVAWSKEIRGDDVVGEDPVVLLQNALNERGLGIKIGALINDTTGTLLAQMYTDKRTKIGVILGTGSNAAYVEKTTKITKLLDSNPRYNYQNFMIINIEWGSFGDNGPGILPITTFDLDLDQSSKNPGSQTFEKMISGMYLGEIFRLMINNAASQNLLSITPVPPYNLQTKSLSDFISAYSAKNVQKCLEILTRDFGIKDATFDISNHVHSLICAIINRSINLCALGTTAIFNRLCTDKTIQDNEMCVIAVDGALFIKCPNYQDGLLAALHDSLGSNASRILLVTAEDKSSVGAAAAVAASIHKKQ